MAASALIVAAAFVFAPELLSIERPLPPGQLADSIVVLGGIPGARAGRAAALFQQHLARRVLVTGAGDCFNNRTILIQQHVPELAIDIECDAKTTKENAQFATRILREQRCRNVILVTSWYHSRRAVHCLEHFAPEIHFYSMPSHEHFGRIPRRWPETRYILAEYAKILGYIPRWGILPI